MAITRKPALKPVSASVPEPDAAAVERFIEGAPDAGKKLVPAPDKARMPGTPKGKKLQISINLTPDVLRRIDEMAARRGQTRNGLMSLLITEGLDRLA